MLNVVFANDSENWVIAVANFDSNIEDDPTAKFFARTILENIPVGTKRTVTQEEQFRKDIQTIDSEIVSLYDKLVKSIFERDKIVLNTETDSEFEKQIKDTQKKIDSLYLEIETLKQKKEEIALSDYVPSEKNITLWKNSTEQLYELPENRDKFAPKDINALVTGSITHIDSFLHVDVQLTLYPGKIVEFELCDAEQLGSVKNLSNRIIEELFVQYSNKENLTLNFAINPPEAQDNAVIHINGNLVRKEAVDNFASMQLTNGVYDIYIESPGYESVAFSQYFGGEDIFNVVISLKEQFSAELEFSLPSVPGDLFFNSQKVDAKGTVTINTLPVLGEFISEDGVNSWLVIDSEDKTRVFDNAHLSFNPKTENPADIIEKKRKIMYHSYSALIASLPVFFILNGQYNNELFAWGSGNGSGDTVKSWEIAKNASMGVSIGLGINWLVQLGLYIYSVNTILPETIIID